MTTEDKGLRERFVDSGLMAQMCCGGDYCNGHPHVVTTDEIIEFIREEKKKSYEEGAATERDLHKPLFIEGMYSHEGNLFAVVHCPEKTSRFFFKEEASGPTDDITPKN